MKLAGFISDADREVDPVASQMVIFCSDRRQTELLARTLLPRKTLRYRLKVSFFSLIFLRIV
jgi:hypothetical protein